MNELPKLQSEPMKLIEPQAILGELLFPPRINVSTKFDAELRQYREVESGNPIALRWKMQFLEEFPIAIEPERIGEGIVSTQERAIAGRVFVRRISNFEMEHHRILEPAVVAFGATYCVVVYVLLEPAKCLQDITDVFIISGYERNGEKIDPEKQLHFAKSVFDSIRNSERLDLIARANALKQMRESKNPSVLSHELDDKNHRKNQESILFKMLEEDFELSSKIRREVASEQDPKKREVLRRKFIDAYVVDFRRVYEREPPVGDIPVPLIDQDWFGLLAGEMKRKFGSKFSPILWELAQGWVDNGYYRMSNVELESAIQAVGLGKYKGATLARIANRLGLKTARKSGPERKVKS